MGEGLRKKIFVARVCICELLKQDRKCKMLTGSKAAFDNVNTLNSILKKRQ